MEDLITVEIISPDGWYSDQVGETFEVKRETTSFRETGGGERVPHYELPAQENSTGMNYVKLIDCRHAKVVSGGD